MRHQYNALLAIAILTFPGISIVTASTENTAENDKTIKIEELKHNMIDEFKDGDPEVLVKILAVIDKTAVSEPALKTSMKNSLREKFQATSNKISEMVKKQKDTLTSNIDMEAAGECLQELKNQYKEKMNLTSDKLGDTAEMIEEIFSDKYELAMNQLDSAMAELKDKDGKMAAKYSELKNEIDQLTKEVQKDLQERLYALTQEMEATIEAYQDQYEQEMGAIADQQDDLEETEK